MAQQQTLRPLAGIRVLDFTAFPPGAACTIMLADLGADVIRIEPPAQKGKPSLVIGQLALSRGKRSITVDLRNPTGIETILRLASNADVVVENAKPGSMAERGYGYPQARKVNSRLIWCAITGYGQDGPHAGHSGHDLNYLAHSGLLGALTEDRSWHPAMSLAAQAGALAAVIGIQGALLERHRTGEGAFVDQSISEAATWLLSAGLKPLSEQPFLLPESADRHLYLCSDGRYVAIACAEPRTWETLCDGLELPEIKPFLHKLEHTDMAVKTIGEKFMRRPAAEWVGLLAPRGAAISIFNHAAQLLDDPQVRARGSVTVTEAGPVPSNPVRILTPSGSCTATAAAAPHQIGADTTDVLLTSGFLKTEIEELLSAGVI